ncbi:MAG: alpha/beta hydrolase [Anaerolineaceae bacterium]|nr:alpha/beta hydrolase [Anaerolineaceae bacterium]
MNKFIKILFTMMIIVVLPVAGFIIWATNTSPIMPEAEAALQTDDQVGVKVGQWLVFEPRGSYAEIGLIFYPGGRVDYRAYAPYAHQLASNGYLVIIPEMPLNLAVLGINKADPIIEAYPKIKGWVIGGHSLGGSMAAVYLQNHPDEINGLILLASYPAGSTDLSGYQGMVLSISADRDGLTTAEDIDQSEILLPASTRFVVIEGGNHAQFGYYGDQKGDNLAIITRATQQKAILEYTLQFLKGMASELE